MTKWAVEQNEEAARAFKINFPNAIVMTDDANKLLNRIINGKKTNARGQTLPKRGEVDVLVGGPPCQVRSGDV